MHSRNQDTKPAQKFSGPVVRTATSPANGHEQGHTADHGHPTPPVEKEAEKRRKRFIGLPLQRPVPHLLPDVDPVPGCPPGLEYLCAVDQVLVNQMLNPKKWVMPKRYVVKNTMDQFIFLAIEESDCRDRWFYCGGRPFDMRLLDYRNVPVLRFIRPLRCDCAWCFCCFCCLQELEVQAPKGTIIGSVRMDFSLSPSFSILDRRDKLVLKIKRPLCPCTFCGKEVLFNIFAPDGVTKLGHIIKLESRLSHNKLTSFDSFSLGFPIDLDVKMKAVLLGALMLIDYMYIRSWPLRQYSDVSSTGGGGGGGAGGECDGGGGADGGCDGGGGE